MPQMLSGNVSLNVPWKRSISGAAPAVEAANAKRSAPTSALRAQSLRMPNSLLPRTVACANACPNPFSPSGPIVSRVTTRIKGRVGITVRSTAAVPNALPRPPSGRRPPPLLVSFVSAGSVRRRRSRQSNRRTARRRQHAAALSSDARPGRHPRPSARPSPSEEGLDRPRLSGPRQLKRRARATMPTRSRRAAEEKEASAWLDRVLK
jgi:hypothetical protein